MFDIVPREYVALKLLLGNEKNMVFHFDTLKSLKVGEKKKQQKNKTKQNWNGLFKHAPCGRMEGYRGGSYIIDWSKHDFFSLIAITFDSN